MCCSIREDARQARPLRGARPGALRELRPGDHLDLDGVREAIEGRSRPELVARRGAQRFAIEPALVDAVLAATSGGRLTSGGEILPGTRPATVEAPFLQLVLERLWRETAAAGEHTSPPASRHWRAARIESSSRGARPLTFPEQDIASGCFASSQPCKTKIARRPDLPSGHTPEPTVTAAPSV
jgi:hypothetical protein